jgi:hypothetical protein
MSYLPVQTKSSRLSETSKAAVCSVLLLALALAAALLIRAVDPPQLLAYIIWGLHSAGRRRDHDVPGHR